jgi:hypothetical protein
VKQQRNVRPKQLLKAFGSIFFARREIARHELLDIGPLASNEEEHFIGLHPSLVHGNDRFCKFVENSIIVDVLDQCRHNLGIDLKIALRFRKSDVVLELDSHLAEMPIENVLSITLRFIISLVLIESFLVEYRPILTEGFLRKYTHDLSGRNYVPGHTAAGR